MEAKPLYVLENVGKTFWDGDRFHAVLQNVSLTVRVGDMIAVTGESGSGKTTLLSILGLLDYQSGGRIRINDEDISAWNEKTRIAWRGRHIGYILQNNYLVQFLTVLENVYYPLVMKGMNRTDAGKRAAAALEQLGISSDRHRAAPQMLSGGEKQRVAIARALAMQPEIVLADEPTGNLDPESAEAVMQALRQMNRNGVTVIMVTHNMQLAAQFARQLTVRAHTLTEQTQQVNS